MLCPDYVMEFCPEMGPNREWAWLSGFFRPVVYQKIPVMESFLLNEVRHGDRTEPETAPAVGRPEDDV
jgi:hypothetical protein